jgi:hypothetical protein
MKKLATFLLMTLSWTIAFCQMPSNTSEESMREIIAAKISTHNNQDWTGEKKTLSDSVKVYEFPNAIRDLTSDGLISRHSKTFAKYPKNKAEIFDIYIVGNKAILKEKVTGRGEPFYSALIYEFDNDKIEKI